MSQDLIPPVDIEISELSEEALKGVIENFILREGTDYGAVELSYDKKFEQLYRQIIAGHLKISFDPNTESVSLVTLQDWQKRSALFK